MMFGTRDRFDYLECAGCGTVQIAKIPDLSLYYPEGYYSFDASADRSLRTRSARLLGRAYYAFKRGGPGLGPEFLDMGLGLSCVLRLGLPLDSRILDVGCGGGRLLNVLSEHKFRSLTGVDLFIERDCVYPNGVKLFKRGLENIEGEFDLIMFHHSFEHVPDPGKTLRAVRQKLARDGVCLVRIPIVNYAWEKYGVNWIGLDPPRHLHLFTERSFRSLADREGLSVEEVVYDSTSFQFSGSEQYLRGIALMDGTRARSLFSRRQMGQWASEARRLNMEGRGDQAAFYLRAK